MTTAGEERKRHIQADRKVLRANGEEAYLQISLTDKQGVVKNTEIAKVSVAIEGAGCIQGFGSADPFSEENFYDMERTTYRGNVLAVIRAGLEPGEIQVTVQAQGYETEKITLEVK